MKKRQHMGELLTPAQERFVGISLMTALTIAVVMLTVIILGAKVKLAPWTIALKGAALAPAAFTVHWALGWMELLITIMATAFTVAVLRDIRKKAAAKTV